MKIKKIYQGELPENKILNAQSTSQTDTYSCEYINKLPKKVFSSEETIIGYNDDGKPVYSKIVYAPSIDCTNEGFKYVAHEIENIKQCLNIVYRYDGHDITGTQDYSNALYNSVITAIACSSSHIRIYVKPWGIVNDWYFTIEYTKTTD